jgi:hypothetical protein
MENIGKKKLNAIGKIFAHRVKLASAEGNIVK